MSKIITLPNNKYRTDVYDKYGLRKRITFDKLSDAKAYVARIEREKYDHKLVNLNVINRKISISDAVNEFLNLKNGIRESTIKKYKNIMHQFIIFSDNNEILYVNDFSRENANSFRQELVTTGATAKTINEYLKLVKSLFEYQVDMDIIVKNPFGHISMLRERSKTMLERENDYYTQQESMNFFEQDINPVYKNAFKGLYLTGCRFQELASLTWNIGIDFGRKLIKIRNTEEFQAKTMSSERDIPMTNHLYKIILELSHSSNSEYVFPSIAGRKLSERTLIEQCKKTGEKAKISKVLTLHKWRHTFASNIERIGLSFEERQYLMGHSSNTMTSYYTKIDPMLLHQKLNQLDDIFEIAAPWEI